LPMGEANRTSWVVLAAGVVGFALGAAILGYAALSSGFWLLGHARAGIHSDWALAVPVGALVGFVLGGVAGAKGAVRLAKSLRG